MDAVHVHGSRSLIVKAQHTEYMEGATPHINNLIRT